MNGSKFELTGIGGCRPHCLVSAKHGSIVTVRIPSASAHYSLSLAADRTETVALALRNALDLADTLGRVLP